MSADLELQVMKVLAQFGERLKSVGVSCAIAADETPMHIGCVDRDLRIYDHRVVIRPEDEHWLEKAVSFTARAGNSLIFAYPEIPKAVESACYAESRELGIVLRGLSVFDVFEGRTITLIDGLFLVKPSGAHA